MFVLFRNVSYRFALFHIVSYFLMFRNANTVKQSVPVAFSCKPLLPLVKQCQTIALSLSSPPLPPFPEAVLAHPLAAPTDWAAFLVALPAEMGAPVEDPSLVAGEAVNA